MGAVSPAAEPFEFRDGDRVALVGDTLIERAGRYGHVELALTLRHGEKGLTFRNLGWSGDNVLGESRAYFGPVSEGYAYLLQYVDLVKPTVIVAGYGNSEAFQGKAGLDGFLKQCGRLLADLEKRTRRIIVLSPTPTESLGPPLPDMSAVNANRELYGKAMAKLAAVRGYRFIDLFSPLRERLAAAPRKLTDNGVHFTAEGYAALAEALDTDLSGTASSPLVDVAGKEKLRKLIVEKDELFFHRYRPANETYLRGFRKHEQGNNAVEIGQFELGKTGGLVVPRTPTVRRWQALTQTPAVNDFVRHNGVASAAADDGALVWAPAYSLVEGDLPLEGLPWQGGVDGHNYQYLRFEIKVTAAGRLGLRLNDPSGLRLWTRPSGDKKPTAKPSEVKLAAKPGEPNVVDLGAGVHVFTLASESQQRKMKPLRIELVELPGSAGKAEVVLGK